MNAEDLKKLQAETERDEAWLTEAMERFPEPQPQSLESVKHRVRIAVHEAALDFGQPLPLSATTVERIKQSVRTELEPPADPEELHVVQDGKRWRTSRRWLTGLAAAAVIVLCATPFYWWKNSAPSPDTVTPLQDFVEVMVSASNDKTIIEMARLERDIDELDDALIFTDDPTVDTEIENLEDELDRLLTEDTMPWAV